MQRKKHNKKIRQHTSTDYKEESGKARRARITIGSQHNGTGDLNGIRCTKSVSHNFLLKKTLRENAVDCRSKLAAQKNDASQILAGDETYLRMLSFSMISR